MKPLIIKLFIGLLLLCQLNYSFAVPQRQVPILVYPFENHSPEKYGWISVEMTVTLVSILELERV